MGLEDTFFHFTAVETWLFRFLFCDIEVSNSIMRSNIEQQFFNRERNRNLPWTIETWGILQKEISFSAGDIIRKHKMVASTLHKTGVVLINMRMYIRR